MSQENVEIVKATFDAWNAGDMEAVRELYDSDVYMRPPQGWPEPGPFVGREAVIRQFEQNRETFDADTPRPSARQYWMLGVMVGSKRHFPGTDLDR